MLPSSSFSIRSILALIWLWRDSTCSSRFVWLSTTDGGHKLCDCVCSVLVRFALLVLVSPLITVLVLLSGVAAPTGRLSTSSSFISCRNTDGETKFYQRWPQNNENINKLTNLVTLVSPQRAQHPLVREKKKGRCDKLETNKCGVCGITWKQFGLNLLPHTLKTQPSKNNIYPNESWASKWFQWSHSNSRSVQCCQYEVQLHLFEPTQK